MRRNGVIVLIFALCSGCISSGLFGLPEPPKRQLEIRAANVSVNGVPYASHTSTRLTGDYATIEFRGETEIRTTPSKQMDDPTEEPACLVFLPLCGVAAAAAMLPRYDSHRETCAAAIDLQVVSTASYLVTVESRVDEMPLLVVRMRTSPYTRIERELECVGTRKHSRARSEKL